MPAVEYYNNLRLGSEAVWERFVAIEINDWLQTALNWIQNGLNKIIFYFFTCHYLSFFSASPSTFHIVHYENVKNNLSGELQTILEFFQLEPNSQRLNFEKIEETWLARIM